MLHKLEPLSGHAFTTNHRVFPGCGAGFGAGGCFGGVVGGGACDGGGGIGWYGGRGYGSLSGIPIIGPLGGGVVGGGVTVGGGLSGGGSGFGGEPHRARAIVCNAYSLMDGAGSLPARYLRMAESDSAGL